MGSKETYGEAGPLLLPSDIEAIQSSVSGGQLGSSNEAFLPLRARKHRDFLENRSGGEPELLSPPNSYEAMFVSPSLAVLKLEKAS